MTELQSYLVTDVTNQQKDYRTMKPTTHSPFPSDVHFRVPEDFMPYRPCVARRRGMTASNFMRSVILDAIYRSKTQLDVTLIPSAVASRELKGDQHYEREETRKTRGCANSGGFIDQTNGRAS